MARTRALSICSCLGCPGCGQRCVTLTPGGRCTSCDRAADRARGTAHERGYDTAWQTTSRTYLAAHPWCESAHCLQLPVAARPRAEHVDHIDGLGPHGPRGHDPDNLRSMCHPCHSRRTAEDQPGGWNARD